MEQERRTPRLDLCFPVLVEYGGEVKRHRAADVSERGMLFVSREPYAIGSELRITFSLPWTDVEIAAQAEVRHINWVKDLEGGLFRIGLFFLEFDQGELHPPIRALPC
jgi:hypothetical protein